MDQLLQRLSRLYGKNAPLSQRVGPPDAPALVGGEAFEMRRSGEDYFWHGLQRGGDPARPFVIFQYTLDGSGVFVEKQRRQKLGPHMAFTAIVPSDHCYYLPPDSTSWSFCWINITHPYIVNRMEQRMRMVGAFLHVPPESMLVRQAYKLLSSIYCDPLSDPFRGEQMLFEFLMEYERAVFQQLSPASEREQLLQQVRAIVSNSLDRPLDVEELAERYAMSRSHFSRYFKQMTGTTPAHYMTQVRLEEAMYLLTHTPLTLEEIAHETGFADANHLCKVCQRTLSLSPGELRRQVRPHLPSVKGNENEPVKVAQIDVQAHR